MKPTAALLLLAVGSAGCGADSHAAQPSASPSARPPPAQPSAPASEADLTAIRATALDYIEGWYAGDGDRMARALHPELAKRIVRTDPATGKSALDQMGAEKLVGGTRAGYGRDTPPDKQLKEVTILDVYEGAATAKIVASDWIDYLHLARFDGRWVIINVLWELKPGAR